MAIGTHQYSHGMALACRPAGYGDSEELERGTWVLLMCPALGMALQPFRTVRARRGMEGRKDHSQGLGNGMGSSKPWKAH